LLVSWCVGGRSRDIVQRIGDGRTGRELGGRTIRRSGDAVCYLHRARGDEDESCLEGGGE
jgi:hypothetical protein